ncbi:MAG: hypothetical protein AAFY03_03790 [Pseudomonadota bacterium]
MSKTPAHRKLLGAALVLGSVGAVVAQEEDARNALPGLQATLDFAQGLVVSDNLENIANPSGTSAVLRTDLAFNIRSETKPSLLALSFGGQYEHGYLADDGGNVSEFRDPFLTFGYTRANASTALNISGSSRQTQIGRRTITEEFDSDDLVTDIGTRTDTRLGVSLETGLGGPWGIETAFNFSARDFAGGASDSLVDRETTTFSFGLRLEPTRTTTWRLSAVTRKEVRDNDAETEQVRNSLGASLAYAVSPTTGITASVAAVRIETEEFFLIRRFTVVEEGLAYALGVQHELQRGTVAASLSSDIVTNGRRTTYQVSRTLPIRGGEISANIGATKTDGNAAQALYGFNIQRDLKNGRYSASLTQTGVTESDGDEFVNTNLRMRYGFDINPISRLDFGLNIAQSDARTDGQNDQEQGRFSVTYSRDLTQDWAFDAGYEHRYSETNSANRRTSNRVFATINRTFNIRP